MGIKTTYKFAAFGSDLNAAVNAGLRDAAFEIERLAVGKAPFKTGNLRNSIGSATEPFHAEVYADADYALFQESNPYNRHYLQESLEETVPMIPEFIRRHT